jgi:hypothetical protein
VESGCGQKFQRVGVPMSSADEFRKYADECLAWAKQAVTDYEREIYLTMAQDWLHATTLAEQPSIPSPSISLGS